MATFNGHRNYNAWNVSLWIMNDEGLYGMALDAIKHCGDKDRAAAMLADELPEETPDGVPFSKTTIREALVGL